MQNVEWVMGEWVIPLKLLRLLEQLAVLKISFSKSNIASHPLLALAPSTSTHATVLHNQMSSKQDIENPPIHCTKCGTAVRGTQTCNFLFKSHFRRKVPFTSMRSSQAIFTQSPVQVSPYESIQLAMLTHNQHQCQHHHTFI